MLCTARPRLKRTRREAQLAQSLRIQLITVLGGVCADCGALELLEVDHVEGRDWMPRLYSQLRRVRKYLSEYEAGVRLRVLCRFCNRKDGAARRWNGRRYA